MNVSNITIPMIQRSINVELDWVFFVCFELTQIKLTQKNNKIHHIFNYNGRTPLYNVSRSSFDDAPFLVNTFTS